MYGVTIFSSFSVTGFVIFYLIISLSLYGRINSGRSMTMGAAAGALCWSVATWAYHIYLQVSVLDTFYGALASVILGFIWLLVSVSSLLLGAALTVEWSARFAKLDREKGKVRKTSPAPEPDHSAE